MKQRNITKLDNTASGFFASESLSSYILGPLASFEYDIDGALGAGQYGMAFNAARGLLHSSVFVYLATKGDVAWLPRGLPRDLREFTFEGLAADDSASVIWNEFWRLECMNPATPADVRRYAEECRRAISDVLHLDKLPAYGSLMSNEDRDRYLERVEELTKACEHIGIKGLNVPDPIKKIRRRATVNRSLRGEDEPQASGSVANDTVMGQQQEECGPTRDQGVNAHVAVQLALTSDDARVLHGILRDYAGEAKQEISRTESKHLRHILITGQELGERVCQMLESAL